MAGARPLALLHAQLVRADARRLGAVVGVRHLAEPGVLERLLGRDALRGVVDKDLLEEVQELRQEVGRRGDDVLELGQLQVAG